MTKYRITATERVEIAMRSRLQFIETQCRFAIANSSNKALVEFAKIILGEPKKDSVTPSA